MSLTKLQARKIALSFAGALEKSSLGPPSIFIEKAFFTSIGSRKPNTVMLRTASFEERDHLIEADRAIFFITDHVPSYKGLLARLEKLDAKTLHALLE